MEDQELNHCPYLVNMKSWWTLCPAVLRIQSYTHLEEELGNHCVSFLTPASLCWWVQGPKTNLVLESGKSFHFCWNDSLTLRSWCCSFYIVHGLSRSFFGYLCSFPSKCCIHYLCTSLWVRLLHNCSHPYDYCIYLAPAYWAPTCPPYYVCGAGAANVSPTFSISVSVLSSSSLAYRGGSCHRILDVGAALTSGFIVALANYVHSGISHRGCALHTTHSAGLLLWTL